MRGLVIVIIVVGACAAPRPVPPATTAAPTTIAAEDPVPAADPAASSWIGARLEGAPVRVTQVVRGAPADRAGLQIGDELVEIAGTPVTSGPDVVRRVRAAPAGVPLAVVVVRDGARLALRIVVASRPRSIAQSSLIGAPAPAFAAPLLLGPHPATLADLRGHVVVVDFWATWCGPCAITIPVLNELHARHAAAGLRIVGLSGEDPAVIRAFAAAAGITYAIGHDVDDRISQAYLREGIPMFVVIDRAGIVRRIVIGTDIAGLEAAVAETLRAP